MAENRVERVGAVHPEGGRVMVKQSMAGATDINAVVARHVAHRVPFSMDARATYGDFSAIGDYQSALDRVLAAQAEFAMLPASVRDHCENDPGRFLEMVFDPARRGELEALGLVEAAAPEAAPAADPKPGSVVVPPVIPVP